MVGLILSCACTYRHAAGDEERDRCDIRRHGLKMVSLQFAVV